MIIIILFHCHHVSLSLSPAKNSTQWLCIYANKNIQPLFNNDDDGWGWSIVMIMNYEISIIIIITWWAIESCCCCCCCLKTGNKIELKSEKQTTNNNIFWILKLNIQIQLNHWKKNWNIENILIADDEVWATSFICWKQYNHQQSVWHHLKWFLFFLLLWFTFRKKYGGKTINSATGYI